MTFKNLSCFLLFLFFVFFAKSQTPFPSLAPVFSTTTIPRIDIQMVDSDLQTLLAPGNEYSDFEYPITFIFTSDILIDTFDQAGFRLRGNTSRNADKKSFKVSFNSYVPDGKFYDLEKLNLNGEHNDPTSSRSRIAWELLRNAGISGSRSNHIELYINNEYYGLYTNVEHIDEKYLKLRYGNNSGNLYKCLWPAHLIWQGFEPEIYQEEFFGRRAYELKTNTTADNYVDLADFINILGNTFITDFSCELEKIFNVDNYLKTLAFEIMIGHWDNYVINKNNFYLYRNSQTGLFEYIPYDFDNTLGVNFLTNFDFTQQNIYNWNDGVDQSRPLYSRILQVTEYKDRLSFYINELIENTLSSNEVFPLLDQVESQVSTFIENDPFFPLDYNFDLSDFDQSFNGSVSNYDHLPKGIRSHLEDRKNSALQQLELNDIPPIITNFKHNFPLINDSIFINALIVDDEEVVDVTINFSTENTPNQSATMFDDGLHQDGLANDGVFGVALAPVTEASILSYSITATDNNNQTGLRPICDTKNIYIEKSSDEISLAINEFMANNTNTIADENGEYEDWIEIHNFGDDPINLRGKYLSDNIELPAKWAFPEMTIEAGGYLLFWADKDQEQGKRHTNFKLKSDGEIVALFNDSSTDYALIDLIEYNESEEDVSVRRLPNGIGDWQTSEMTTPNYSNDPLDSGTKDLKLKYGLSIYPNPVLKKIHLKWEEIPHSDLHWEIIDLMGRSLQNGILEDMTVTVVLDNGLPNGLYTFRLTDRKGTLIGVEKLLFE